MFEWEGMRRGRHVRWWDLKETTQNASLNSILEEGDQVAHILTSLERTIRVSPILPCMSRKRKPWHSCPKSYILWAVTLEISDFLINGFPVRLMLVIYFLSNILTFQKKKFKMATEKNLVILFLKMSHFCTISHEYFENSNAGTHNMMKAASFKHITPRVQKISI